MGEERRQFSRADQPFEARGRIYGELTESWHTITTLNISAAGMRFRSDDMLPLGTVLELEVNLPCLREPLVVRGRVVWSRAVASGVAENGVEFINVSLGQSEQIDQLVKFLMKNASPPTHSP